MAEFLNGPMAKRRQGMWWGLEVIGRWNEWYGRGDHGSRPEIWLGAGVWKEIWLDLRRCGADWLVHFRTFLARVF